MNVRLGIVCPKGSRATFELAAATLSGVTPVWIEYGSEEEIVKRVQFALNQCDCICFSGELPYAACQEILPPDLPKSVVRLTSVDVAVGLLRARDVGVSKAPFSIDTVDPGIVMELAAEVGISPDSVACEAHNRTLTLNEVVAFHVDAHKRLGTSFAITGRSNAVKPLSDTLNVPVFAAVPVVPSIRVALNRAALNGVSNKNSEMRFAAALFRVLEPGDLMESEVRRLNLARAIHDAAAFDDAWVEARSGGPDVLVFANKGLMQRLTDQWTATPILTELQKSLRIKIAVGFGLGDSARRSVEFAEIAVRHAAEAGPGNAYLVSEDGVVIGPIGLDTQRAPQRELTMENSFVTQLAGRLGLGVDTVARLVALERESRGDPVTPHEIATKLRLTPASGRRIVRRLKDHGVVTHDGTTSTSGPGRPTNTYVLRLSEELLEREGN